MASNSKISNLISSQVPFFVRNDHQNFITFLEAYYEFLEQEGETLDVIKNVKNYADIDYVVDGDQYSEELYKTFLNEMPRNIVADKKMILKNIKDFYRARGTENATRFLMRALFGYDVEFYYPKRDILKASDAKWFIEKSIRVGDIKVQGNANNDIVFFRKFTNTQIKGNTSKARAVVESVDVFLENGVIVNELKLSNQEKDFTSGEEIFAQFDEDGEVKNISATIFSGILSDVIVLNGGTKYKIGDDVIVESNTGNGAVVRVSAVSNGRLKTIASLDGGAGFSNGDFLLISGGGGIGGNANVQFARADGKYHPAFYNVVISTIESEANTTIGNAVYSNLVSSISDPANTSIANSMSYFVYGPTGPVERIRVLAAGDNYREIPNLDIIANTRIRALGVLGRMEIMAGGQGYNVGDKIEFINQLFSGGTGALANVKSVDANGSITEVQFDQIPGHFIGGQGYSNDRLPAAVVKSSNLAANGANVIVLTVLGDGEKLTATTDEIGTILELQILNRGLGYETPPTLNLSNSGSGTAQAVSTIITGIYSYPGRYVSDDGIISGFNFLQSRDYYQNYSYVIKTKESIEKYRSAIKNLTHPAGMKLWGEYMFDDENLVTVMPSVSSEPITQRTLFTTGTYKFTTTSNGSNVVINKTTHGLTTNDTVYLEFTSGNTINTTEGYFTVKTANANSFFVLHPNIDTAQGDVQIGIIVG
jgi:hypothetical protein